MGRCACRLVFAIAAAVYAAAVPRAQAPAVVTVHGRVVDAVTGDPVAGADVALNVAAINGASYKTVSAEDGRYFINNVPAGKYYLFAQKPGFFTAGLNDESQPGCSDLLIVGWPGPAPLNLRLRPHGLVTGVVKDESDRPVRGAKVQLLSRSLVPSGWGRRWTWESRPTSEKWTTDANGRYAFAEVKAGDYVIQIDGGDVDASLPEPRAFGTHYYPGTRHISEAVPIHLGIAEKRSADLRVTSRPAFDLAGIAFAPERRSVSIGLVAVDGPDEERRHLANLWADSDGRFVFPRLPAGDYLLLANVNDDFWAEQRVRLSDRNLTNVEVRLVPSMVVTGRVVWEGVERPPDRSSLIYKGAMGFEGYQPRPEEIEEIRARMPISLAGLRSVGAVRGSDTPGGRSARWTSETTFSMNVTPGRYAADMSSANGWYVKSFLIDGREMVDEPVDVLSGSTSAVLTLTRAVGRVDVTMVSGNEPGAYCGFVLFSTNRRTWPAVGDARRHGVIDFTDETGRSSLAAVMPGEYYVAAVSIDALDDLDEKALARLAGTARKVTVPPTVPTPLTLACVR